MTRIIHLRLSGEIPEGRAKIVFSLCAYARQRTLEPVLEPGVTETAVLVLVTTKFLPTSN